MCMDTYANSTWIYFLKNQVRLLDMQFLSFDKSVHYLFSLNHHTLICRLLVVFQHRNSL